MNNQASTDLRTITRLVVAVPLTDAKIERLRQRFPQVQVVVVEPQDLTTALADADAVATWELTTEQIAAAPRLRWLQTGGAGVDGMDLPELAARNVVVTNVSGVHAINIGEHVLAMMLAFARQIPHLVRAQDRREWRDHVTRDHVFELYGQTLLLVGLGDIAAAIAERAAAFGMRVLAIRRRLDLPTPAAVETVIGTEQLGQALGQADHVVICLPLTRRTRGMFDAETLSRTKRGAYLYNIGRGPVVDTAALVAALESGHLAGAGLDVVDPEPLPAESPLWAMENVLITAHTSGGTPRYWDRGFQILETNIARALAGEPLVNVVDLEQGY